MSVAGTGLAPEAVEPPSESARAGSPERVVAPSWPVAGVHLAVLWSLAVAQPLFDVLDDGPEFFVARGSERSDILVLTFGLVLLPPLAMAVAYAGLALLRPTLARALHAVLVALLVSLLAIQVLKRVGELPAAAVLAGGVVVGGLLARSYMRRVGWRTFLTVLAPAPALFVVLFLTGPVGRLVWEETSAAAPAQPITARAPVVFVVLDELPVASLMNPDGRINAQRFPNFARLARGSTWFRNTTTVHGGTQVAVPALLTGRVPRESTLPVALDHPRNLFTLFGASYRVDATEAVTRICPPEVCRRDAEPLRARLRSLAADAQLVYLHALLPDAVAARLPNVTDTWVDFRTEDGASTGLDADRLETLHDLTEHALSADQPTRFASFVARMRRTERPTFRYLHVLLPHGPFRFLPSGERYEPPAVDGLVDGRWGDTPAAPRVARQRHLLQLGLTDRLLGRLLARLKTQGLYDDAAIVVVSDHGASFRPEQTRRDLSPATIADLAFVPFFVKAPGQRTGRVVDRHVRTIDVLPTLADVLGVALPWHVEGRSALAAGAAPTLVTLHDGEGVTARNDELLRRRARTLAEQARVFGTGGFDARFYALGGHASLVGTAPRGARQVGNLAVDLDLPSGPAAWITGRLTGSARREGVRLAVAVDGRIAGTATAYRAGDDVVFALMLAPAARPDGVADVRVYRIRERPLRLEELRQA